MAGVISVKRQSSADGNIVDLSTLRQVARTRFAKAQAKADPNGAQAKAPKNSSHDSLLGLIVMSTLLTQMGVTASDFGLGTDIGGQDAFGLEKGTLSTIFDFYTTVRDEAAVAKKYRRLNDYPEGRRQDPIATHSLNKKFNLVSANDNGHFAGSAQAEMTAMADILDMVEALEKEGVLTLQIGQNQSAYQVLKGLSIEASDKVSVIKSNTPMRKLA